jgi:glutathionyl-hydroquinone reductase
MGYLMRGTWVDQWYDTASSGGRFVRQGSRFHSWVGEDSDFLPEAGRYHLYVSWACPWAHRTLIYRVLKGLEDAISVTVVDPLMLSNGWVIAADADPVNHAQLLWQVYAKADPNYIGRATVPVLWDRRRETIVNNGHFKCNPNRLVDFPELWDYARTLYQVPGVAKTVHFDHIKTHYYGSHRTINPTGVVAAGPRVDFSAPTRRAVPKLGG